MSNFDSSSAPDLVYFHPERGRLEGQAGKLGLHSANLIDFFVEVARQVPNALIVLPRAEDHISVTIQFPNNIRIQEVPFPTKRSLKELRWLWSGIRMLSSKPFLKQLSCARYSVSAGLEFFGILAGLVRILGNKRFHSFIVRGDRITTVRMSSRSIPSKALLLLRLYSYRYIMDVLVRRGWANVWFQGELNRDAFLKRIGNEYAPRLRVLNAVLRCFPKAFDLEGVKKLYDIVFVGHLHKEKGIFDLVEAIKLLRDGGREVQVQMIGAGVDGALLRETVSSAGLDPFFEFIGYLSDPGELANRLALSKLFVLPSHTEGMPRAMVEAMSLGVPVLVTKVGGIPYIIKNGVNGWIVEPRDPKALACCIAEVLSANYSGTNKTMVSAAQQLAYSMSFANKASLFLNNAHSPQKRGGGTH